MSVIGVDFGNGFTKTSKNNIIFKSSYMVGFDSDLNKDAIKIELDGEKYTVGVERDKGCVDVNVNTRYESKLHEICILTALALSYDESVIRVSIVGGTPADNYDSLKDSLRNKILSYSNKSIKITQNGKTKTKFIEIKNVMIMPQSAVVFLDPAKYRHTTNFVLDIGGGTAIASIWRGLKLFKARTIGNGGMLRLYTAIAQALNKVLVTDYNTETIQHVLETRIIRDGVGKKFHIDEDYKIKKIIDTVIQNHIAQIASNTEEVLGVEPIQSDIQVLMGGGALSNLILPGLQNQYKDIEVIDCPQFANAMVYESVGKAQQLDR